MKALFASLACLLAASTATSAVSRIAAAEPDAVGIEFFELKIRPVLAENCYECHSSGAKRDNKLKGALLLDSSAGIHDGGETGALVRTDRPAESLLIKALRYEELEMPPKARLPDAIIGDFEKWIGLGAPVPSELPEGANSTAVDWAKARASWAFCVPAAHDPPSVSNSAWPKKTLDFFILSALDQRQLHPVQPASKSDLIRRATFDLIGLPPTPEECTAFERDESPDAFAKVVERLLASPHFGERWARYWLDLARYADDQGNSFLSPAPTAYLYRDWVVRAFNRDVPYDEFIRLQLAGDELASGAAASSGSLVNAEDYVDRLAGLGFQGLGPVFRKGAAGEAKAKADELEDRVDTMSRALLGLTVSCARCHDHKFDPIPTRDYYSLAAAYNGAIWGDRMLASPEVIINYKQWEEEVKRLKTNLDKWPAEQGRAIGHTAMRQIDAYLLAAYKIAVLRAQGQPADEAALAASENLAGYFLSRFIVQLKADNVECALPAFRETAARLLPATTITAGVVQIPDELRQLAAGIKNDVNAALAATEPATQTAGDGAVQPTDPKPAAATPAQQDLLRVLWSDGKSPFFVNPQDAPALTSEAARGDFAARQAEHEQLSKSPPVGGPVMPSVSGGGEAMQVFVRGNPTKLGEPAPPGFLRVLSGVSETPTGNHFGRLQLSESIASRQNPLTARVFVNRVWHYHFGRGIVATLGNFGKLGTPPTHPELLDTLAVGFMQSGWSIKWLHREIMLSATWQLSSAAAADNFAKDPDNHYLWRMAPRRLDIEAWRDALLAVSGRLDSQVGGPALDQKNPGLKEMADFPGFTRLVGLDVDNPANGRRSIYGIVSRYAPNSALTLFDFPEPNVASDLRNVTTVPQQQLFVLNSPFMIEMSRAFAQRLERTAQKDEDRLKLAWSLAYSRPPTTAEIAASLEFIHSASEPSAADKLSRWDQLCHAILSSNEFAFLP